MVTFLARYAKLAGKEISATEDLSSFTDSGSVSPLCRGEHGMGCREPVSWKA